MKKPILEVAFDKCKSLRAENKLLRDALEWYALDRNYRAFDEWTPESPVWHDGGERAKQALRVDSTVNDAKNVHTEHCCKEHGCKYAEDDCPVVLGTMVQSFPCESCVKPTGDNAK